MAHDVSAHEPIVIGGVNLHPGMTMSEKQSFAGIGSQTKYSIACEIFG